MLLLPIAPAVILITVTVAGLIVRIAFTPLLAAVSTGLAIFRISGHLVAMIIRSPTALAFGRKAYFLVRVEWRGIKRLVAIGANRFPGFHLELRALIGPAILRQEKSNQE